MKKGSICMAAGVLLLAAAFSLVLYNIWDANRAERAAESVVVRLEEAISEKTELETAPAEEKREMPTIEIDGNFYIGVVEIPSLNLLLPVMADWSDEKLKTAPCRYSGSYFENDLVIAGHNYARHFSPLKWIEVGSEVLFTDVEENVHYYTVAWTEPLMPQEVEEMMSGDWDLTLFTCTTGGASRWTVRCIEDSER